MVPASSHCNGRSARAKINRYAGRCVEVDVASTIAQLSGATISPALHITVVEDGAGVVPASIYRNRRTARAKVNRIG